MSTFPAHRSLLIDWKREFLSSTERSLCVSLFKPLLPRLLQEVGPTRIGDHDAAFGPLALNLIDGFLTKRWLVIGKSGLNQWNIVLTLCRLLHEGGVVQIELTDGEARLMALESDASIFIESTPDQRGLKAELLDHSQPFDVHTWSTHHEVGFFVDQIYNELGFASAKVEIEKKHLKKVLVDLYARWSLDPSLKTGFSRNHHDYEAGSRYNALHISKKAILVVDRLVEADLLFQVKGYHPDVGEGRQTRIWPTPQLMRRFSEARFSADDLLYHFGQETIIVRDVAKRDVAYEDTDETSRMRETLSSYNELLSRTLIDIPSLEEPYLETKNGSLAHLGSDRHFVRRIFSRGSFKFGGRFYGGWWQRCPRDLRSRILINDQPTVEIDFSGLHIVMLYARLGIDYWHSINSDPYLVGPREDFEHYDPDYIRGACKKLLLVAVNAKNDTSTIRAYRNDLDEDPPEIGLTHAQGRMLLDALREKHAPIAHLLAKDAGIELMNKDAKITEHLIKFFTMQGIPILTIHDSYIVPAKYQALLDDEMRWAFKHVTGIEGVKLKTLPILPEPAVIRCKGYQKRLRNWVARQGVEKAA